MADTAKLDHLLVALLLDSYPQPVKELILDVDSTDDPVHGEQEGRCFNAYYDEYWNLPPYVTCGPHVLSGTLRTANRDAADGAQIREHGPRMRVSVRSVRIGSDSRQCFRVWSRWRSA